MEANTRKVVQKGMYNNSDVEREDGGRSGEKKCWAKGHQMDGEGLKTSLVPSHRDM